MYGLELGCSVQEWGHIVSPHAQVVIFKTVVYIYTGLGMVKHLNVCVFYKITEENFLPKIVQIGTFGWGYMEK